MERDGAELSAMKSSFWKFMVVLLPVIGSAQDLPLHELTAAWCVPGLSSATNVAEWSGRFAVSPAASAGASPAYQTNNAWAVNTNNGFRNAASAPFATNDTRGAWIALVKMPTATAGVATLFFTGSTVQPLGFGFGLSNGNLRAFIQPVATTNGQDATVTGTASALSTGVWTFVGATSDGTNMNLYVNGSRIAVATNSPPDDSFPSGYAGGWGKQVGLLVATVELDVAAKAPTTWFNHTVPVWIAFQGYQRGRRWSDDDMARWNALLVPTKRGLP